MNTFAGAKGVGILFKQDSILVLIRGCSGLQMEKKAQGKALTWASRVVQGEYQLAGCIEKEGGSWAQWKQVIFKVFINRVDRGCPYKQNKVPLYFSPGKVFIY